MFAVSIGTTWATNDAAIDYQKYNAIVQPLVQSMTLDQKHGYHWNLS